MYLLIRNKCLYSQSSAHKFTSQHVSINSAYESGYTAVLAKFTSQHVSINSKIGSGLAIEIPEFTSQHVSINSLSHCYYLPYLK